MKPTKCFLRSSLADYPSIFLAHGQTVLLGRGPLTKIKDTRLSKEHIKACADYEKATVRCEHVGQNRSMIKGQVSKKGDIFTSTVRHGDEIQLLEGQYLYKVDFVTQNVSHHWSQGLMESTQNPEFLEIEDETVVVIKDKYPKAQKHFLVLPKEKLSNFTQVDPCHHVPLFEHMIWHGKQLIEKYSEVKLFRMGFHAVPSMAQVHMHVISQDFVSDCLKTKKHWNSFNTPYFIEAEKVLEMLKSGAKICQNSDQAKEYLSKQLKCNQCEYVAKNMPDLKKHLQMHFCDQYRVHFTGHVITYNQSHALKM